MDSSHLKVAGLGLVFGAILAGGFFWLGIHEVLQVFHTGGAQPPPAQASNPNDSPVTMRGGSVEGLSYYPWSQPDKKHYPAVWETSGFDTTVVTIEGNKGGTTPGIFSATGISSNWEITLYLRDQDGHADYDSGSELVLCSKRSEAGCDQTGTLSSGSNTLSLIADGKNAGTFWADLTGAAGNALDGYSLLRYDVPSCGAGAPRDTRCNHLSEIDVSNIPALNGSYTCQAGGCEIGIGPPIVVVAKPRK